MFFDSHHNPESGFSSSIPFSKGSRLFDEHQFPRSMSPRSRFSFDDTDGRDQFRTEAKPHPVYTTTRNPRERNSSGSSGFSEEDGTGYKSADTGSQGSNGSTTSDPFRGQDSIPIKVIHEKSSIPSARTAPKQSTSSPRSTPTQSAPLHECSGETKPPKPKPKHSHSSDSMGANRNRKFSELQDEFARRNRASSAPPESTDDTGPEKYQSKGNIKESDGPPPPARPPRTSLRNGFPMNQSRFMEQSAGPPSTEGSRNIPTEHVYTEHQQPPVGTGTVRKVPIVFEKHQKSSPASNNQPKPAGNQHQPPRCSTPNNATQDAKQGPEDEPPTKPQPEEPKKPLTTVEKLQQIHDDVRDLKATAENFSGSKKSKEFLYLDEMLTRNLLKLDLIETEGLDEIRQKRKAVVRDINNSISLLESRCEESDDDIRSTDETPVTKDMGDLEIKNDPSIAPPCDQDTKVTQASDQNTPNKEQSPEECDHKDSEVVPSDSNSDSITASTAPVTADDSSKRKRTEIKIELSK